MHPIFHGLAEDRPSTPKPYDLIATLIAMAYGSVILGVLNWFTSIVRLAPREPRWQYPAGREKQELAQ